MAARILDDIRDAVLDVARDDVARGIALALPLIDPQRRQRRLAVEQDLHHAIDFINLGFAKVHSLPFSQSWVLP